ncbi:restriction endonuclease subunit S [Bacteroides thetaiotaomicron]|uniref:restriction endonuclease subunit S n=1 Tax=Bacteroides thetaiotaomicron TaxID=818 RepID=UPI001CE34BAF|nr:restriction endonuclease subunit S [Bacteroides thetaiotaomicron]MCA5990104.1 restriction endonuclease subunit S [Bacteroides thetaiotaomicron]
MSQFIEMFGDQNTNDKGWSESLVKDEFKLSMGKTPARNNPECWDNGNHKWVSISDMSSYARYTGDTSEYITDYAIADSGIKPVPKGTIIMSFKLSIGRTAITSEDIYTNEAIMAFADFDEKKFNIDFLHFLIANKNWLLGAKQAVKGQTLNKESIGNAKIIIPPIEMQEQFASIYNQADKSEFVGFKSQFIEMFGNPLSSIQKNELKKLGDCCQINPRRPSVSISDSDLVSFVPMPAVNEDGYIDGATNEEYGKVKKGFTYFENNDVLFAKITPCMENGKGAIAEALTNGIGMGSTEFHVLRPIEGISNPYWLLTLTRMPIFRECAAKNMSGTGGQRRVGAAFLENFMIGLPSISEQETFETIYRQADKSEYYN